MNRAHYISQAASQRTGESLAPVASGRETAKRVFLLSLLLSTWIPLCFFIFLGQSGVVSFSLEQIKIVLLFLGGAHVQATLFFYTDRDFRQQVSENRIRYVYLPLILIIGSGLVFALASRTVQAYLFLFYWAWQAYHYGRQNVGVYAFASLAQRQGPPQKSERLALELATYCGILGTFKVLGTGVVPVYLQGFFDFLYGAGYFCYLALFIFGLYAYVRNIRHTTLTKTLFFLTLLCFFYPIYLSNNILVAFSSYAIAHGLQYIIFMMVVSVNAEREIARRTMRNVFKLMLLTLLVGFAFYRVADLKGLEFIRQQALLARSLDFLVGAVFGATMAHFVIDAGAWRLSRAAPRAYMVKRFGFILDARDPVSVRPDTTLDSYQRAEHLPQKSDER
jgi:hypothetical protein